MRIDINGKRFYGVAIGKLSDRYEIEVKANGHLDLFTMQSCHRDVPIEGAGENGIFGDKRKVRLEYEPSGRHEYNRYCALRLSGYEKDRGRHSWGFIDFQTEAETLMGTVHCNGETSLSMGVSACQSRSGLQQSVSFTDEIDVESDCDFEVEDTNLVYEMRVGECVFAIMSEGGELHRHTSLGYNSIMIRGG